MTGGTVARSDDGYRPSYRRAVTVIPCHTHVVRPRSPAAAVTVAITVMTGAAILAGCGSEDDGGDTQRFCADVAANAAAIVTPPLTEDDVDSTLDLYRDLADAAPITIEEEMARPAVERRDGEHRGPRRSRIGPADRRRRLRHREVGRRGAELGAHQLRCRPRTGGHDRAAGSGGHHDVGARRLDVARHRRATADRAADASPPRCRQRHSRRRCHRPTCHRRPVPPVDQQLIRPVDQTISPRRRMTLSTRP